MDFERIFPFIVLYFVWRIFLKKQKKKQKSAKPKVASGKVDVAVSPAAVLKQMLFGGIEMPQTMTQGRSGQEVYDAPLQYPSPEEDIAEGREAIIPEEDNKAVARAEYFSEDVVEIKSRPERCQSVKYGPNGLICFRKDLQKAVIWSEILAPPLGLRN